MTQEKNVMISIFSRQDFHQGEPDVVELTTAGSLLRTEEGFRISYEESALTGMEGTHTRLDVLPERVVVTRSGALNAQIVFEKDVRHLSCYDTPLGQLEVGVATRSLRSTIDEEGGELYVDYAVDIARQVSGRTVLHMKVKEKKFTQ